MFDRLPRNPTAALLGLVALLLAGRVSAQAPATTLPGAPAPIAGQNAFGVISGTVLDTNSDVVQGAHLVLQSGRDTRVAISGGDGQFEFQKLAAGEYKLTASAPHMSTYVSGPIALGPNGSVIVPTVVLSVTSATSVVVSADKEELSVQQMQIAENQRVFGVLPNFYTAFDWTAPPMLAKQKYHLALRALFDPVSFITVAGVAGAEQYQNIFPAYGPGITGYAKRYGAAFANHASGDFFGRALYPAVFHQDPRYFYKGKGRSGAARALYAVAAAFIARGDNGHWQPNYSGILGDFTSGAVSNLYYPAADRGASLVLYNGLADIGADAASNLIREFILRNITSHVPKGANGQPANGQP